MPLIDTLDPIFADCVADEDGRYTLTEPWIRQGFIYATDGRIAVRQPITQPDTTDYGSPANAGQMFDDSKLTGKAITLPDIGPEPSAICTDCKGRKPKKCGTCHGSGECACSVCDSQHTCGSCDGHGKRPWCSPCDGEGTITRTPLSVALDDPDLEVGLADTFIWLLQRHGIETVQKTQNGTGFRFRKGTIEGLVMGATL